MGFNPAAPGRGISGGNIPNWGFDLFIFSWILGLLHKLSFFLFGLVCFLLLWWLFVCLLLWLFLFVCLFVCSVVDV